MNRTMKPKSRSKIKRPRKLDSPLEEDVVNPRDFSLTVTKVAVSQICQSVGFKAAQRCALDTLTGVATKYMEAISKWAASYSHASNRTEPNLIDLINAAHDMCLFQGFVGASKLDSSRDCLLKSSVLKDLSFFVKYTDEIPFAKPIPRHNNNSSKNLICSAKNGENSKGLGFGLHIPKWLPAFPEEKSPKEAKEMIVSSRRLWEDELDSKLSGSELGEQRSRSSSDLAMERGKVRFKIRKKMKINCQAFDGGFE